jgi:hypothetical protein
MASASSGLRSGVPSTGSGGTGTGGCGCCGGAATQLRRCSMWQARPATPSGLGEDTAAAAACCSSPGGQRAAWGPLHPVRGRPGTAALLSLGAGVAGLVGPAPAVGRCWLVPGGVVDTAALRLRRGFNLPRRRCFGRHGWPASAARIGVKTLPGFSGPAAVAQRASSTSLEASPKLLRLEQAGNESPTRVGVCGCQFPS